MPRGHLFMPRGRQGASVCALGSTFCAQIFTSILTYFFKKMLNDYEFDDDNKSDELQNDGVVMLKGI